MSTSDPAATYAALRDETAEMLKLDAANLSLVEGLQLDLVSLLRLEVDGLQGQVLAGAAVDLSRLSTALAMLQKLLPMQLAPAAAAERDDFAGAREELRQLFARRFEALSRRRDREEIELAADPAKARAEAHAEFEARLARAIEKHGSDVYGQVHLPVISDPGGSDAQSDEGVSLPPSAAPDAPAARSESPPPPPSTPRRSLDEINAEPANPAPGPREPWRDYVNSDGIISPWFRPHG